jgi:PAT family beta-lactamase induction signal transducer AmpG
MFFNKNNTINYRNILIIAILGFSSGLPLSLTGAALQGWLAEENIDIITIGMLGLVSQPYIFKFIWAPLLDRFALPILGYRTGWIFITQLGLVFAILGLSFSDPNQALFNLALFALLISFLSATQDIAFDAYRTELLAEQERGIGSVVYVYGYRIAMIVSSGGSFLLSYYIGWQSTFIIIATLMALCSLVTLIAKEPIRVNVKPKSLYEVVIEPFYEFIARPKAIYLLLLIITYKLGEAFAMALTTPFLIQTLHFTTQDVGLISKTMGVIATLIGLSIGGVLINRLGLYYSLMWFGIFQALTNILYYWLAIVGHNYFVMAFTILSDQFSGGLATAALMVLLMTICNQKYTATQFALLSALSSLGRVYVVPISGYIVDSYGWENFFLFSVVMCLPGLICLRLLKNKTSWSMTYSHKTVGEQRVDVAG